jgi:hypothetical protein
VPVGKDDTLAQKYLTFQVEAGKYQARTCNPGVHRNSTPAASPSEEGDNPMRLIKVLGLAAVAALTAMAFIGTSSSLAEDTIVVCKELIEVGKLCPEGKLWAQESKLLLLAKEPVLEGSLTVKCEDSIATATLGGPAAGLLPVSIDVVFGKLPTPKLGEGCSECSEVHTPLLEGWIKVKGTDEFYLEASGSATLLHCTFLNLTCIYGAEKIQTPIKHDGTHPLHEGTNLALLKIEATLFRKTGSSGLCAAEGLWKATYVATLVHQTGSESGLGWPALDKP